MHERRRSAKDIGRESPPSESVKEQQIAGESGGPQSSRQRPRAPKQPPQTSGRRGAAHQHAPAARKRFEADEAPELQGEGEASPHVLKERSSLQGFRGRGERGRAMGGEDVTGHEHSGEPA